jgi:release factor glutamine methyltransferase
VFVQTNSVQAIKAYFKDRLKEKFTDSEIKLIVRSALMDRLKISSADFLLSDGKLLSESDLLFFRSIVKRLLNSEPFQYVMGKTEFYGLELKTDKRALIPRPETEELVSWIVEDHPEQSVFKMLDLCTGSGCIALALKSHFTNSEIVATDLSKDALELAKENAGNLEMNIVFLNLNALDEKGYTVFEKHSFDVWVSNPPYIPYADQQAMEQNVLDFEPHMALFVEDHDALLFYREIARQGKDYLKNGAKIYFEIHEDLGQQTVALLESFGYSHVLIRKDLQGKERMVRAEWKF